MDQLFDVEDSARILAISAWTVRALLRKGKLSPVRIGRRVCLEESELQRFIDESRTPKQNSATEPLPELTSR
jgi:excisionase family DNA binding protein